jgi:two-component system, cell cycle sensor histidine kinase and response regulator CckA
MQNNNNLKMMNFPVQSILNNIQDAVILTTETGSIQMMNSAAIALSGIFPNLAIGSNIHDADPMFSAASLPCSSIMAERKSVLDTPNGTPFTNGNGRERILSIDKYPLLDYEKKVAGYLWTVKEISELVRIRNEFQKAQALESISFLAAGVAHDFNNLLSGVFGFIDLAYQSIDSPADCAEYLDGARNVIHRTRDLTTQLLNLSKGGIAKKKVVSMASLIRESLSICMLGVPVKQQASIDDDLWCCEADPGQFSQALNNLLINAVQAMPDGGTVLVSASNVTLTDNEVASLPAGPFIKITIHDTGKGISHEAIDHIFDPYFTTKEKGCGLGLAVTWSVIKRHQGHIAVESIPGSGTLFTIYVPASSAAADTSTLKKSIIISPSAGLRVLVMDDDPIIRHVFDRILHKMNCEVTLVVSGEHALETLRCACTRNIAYDAAILDLTIPGGKAGKEIIAEIRDLFPDIKTIAVSGYTCDPVFDNPGAFGFHYCLKKPFLTDELLLVLNEIKHVPDKSQQLK